jgi:hypothetical protein
MDTEFSSGVLGMPLEIVQRTHARCETDCANSVHKNAYREVSRLPQAKSKKHEENCKCDPFRRCPQLFEREWTFDEQVGEPDQAIRPSQHKCVIHSQRLGKVPVRSRHAILSTVGTKNPIGIVKRSAAEAALGDIADYWQ